MLLYPSIRVYEIGEINGLKSRLDVLIKVFLYEKSVYPLKVIVLQYEDDTMFLRGTDFDQGFMSDRYRSTKVNSNIKERSSISSHLFNCWGFQTPILYLKF